MINQDIVRQLQSLLENARTIFIMYGSDPSLDQLAVGTALHQAILSSGKDAQLFSPQKPSDDFRLAGAEATKTEVGNQNLTVSFNYSEEAVDKVSYHIGEETNKFYLTIKPKKGSEPLSADDVEFSYTGADTDLIFVIGVDQLENLEQLYFGYENLFRDVPVVSLNTFATGFGTVKINTGSAGSMSEIVAKLLFDLGFTLDDRSATNLLMGIDWATDSFQSFTSTAETFEMVGALMRSGARRIKRRGQLDQASVFQDSLRQQSKPRLEQAPTQQKPREITVSERKQSQDTKGDGLSKRRKVDATKPGGLKHQPGKDVSSK